MERPGMILALVVLLAAGCARTPVVESVLAGTGEHPDTGRDTETGALHQPGTDR